MLETLTTQKATVQSTLRQHLMGTPHNPAKMPHPTETCEDTASLDQRRMRHVHLVVHFPFEGQTIKLTLFLSLSYNLTVHLHW